MSKESNMNKNEISDFFDRCAAKWDEDMVRNEQIIKIILDNAGIKEGTDVLDVACGTGVLFPDYLKRGVKSLIGVDISPKMAEIARKKFTDKRVKVICADIEDMESDSKFDCCMVYNAFPHFPDPERLVKILAQNLRSGGVLSVAHGMSREAINRHHSGSACNVSRGLLYAEDLAKIFEPYFEIYCIISNESMYQVCGTKK